MQMTEYISVKKHAYRLEVSFHQQLEISKAKVHCLEHALEYCTWNIKLSGSQTEMKLAQINILGSYQVVKISGSIL